jgi:FMN phosphatase YigB (HAD superfamily)
MPGGKGNIKPEDGKQFSSEYQPEEKWTEEKALQLGNDLIDWMKNNEINMFWEEYLVMERDLYPELIAYLSNKFTSFLKLIGKAKKVQEIKLKKYGTADKLNATITKFVLINEHGWKDKQETEHIGGIALHYDQQDSKL